MVTINMIFFTVTFAKRTKSRAELAKDAHVSRMMKNMQEKRDEYTRFLP
ncbi:YrzI family small protein [Aneurinibacillus sp. REN35]